MTESVIGTAGDLAGVGARSAEYLARIGAVRPAAADAAALRELHERHLRSVPFENLSIHLGEEVSLRPEALAAKLIDARRGGFCYELNGAFAALLRELGYPVTLLAARVFGGGRLGPPFDHLALRVEAGGEPWLADVGFGKHSTYPLRLDERGDQRDPGGVFRIEETSEGDLDVYLDGAPQYRLETRPRELADFEMACWWQCTSPKSHFTKSPVCSMPTAEGRVTLSGRTLITADASGRHEMELAEDAVLGEYRDNFGIVLDRIPAM
ncbi:MAG: arylamine N-acetyltransferase [Streptosporangiales bacterium]|nr:arylamine N-acetyltransferase [Streptosporangiales bacterium]